MGNSWYIIDPPGTQSIGPGRFTTPLLGVALGLVSKLSTNGGLSWTDVSNHLPGIGTVSIHDQQFINSDTGYYVGIDFYPEPIPCCYDGVIFKTTNSGENWNLVHRQGADISEEVFFKDTENGITLIQAALVMTSNGGLTWIYNNSIRYDIEGFISRSMTNPFKDTIFVAGVNDTGGVVIKSTDHGKSWNTSLQLHFKSRFRKINFVDNNIGYAVGDTGLIVKTTNGGNNWTVLNSGTRRRLNGVSFINKDTGFVVGDSGLVLTTFTGGLVGIPHENAVVPADFKLHQNFPNPFNPTTTITFELSKSNFVRLRIFNNNGKEIRNLVNEYKSSGTYSIPFETNDLPSGVYFYKLEVKGYSQTKRMLLLK